MSNSAPSPILSVVVAVGDVEESVGRDVRRIAEHLRAREVPFEIVAVNDGSCDNSMTVLRILSAEVPELRLYPADASGRAFMRGASEARGELVALVDVARGALPLAALGWALARLEGGARHAVVFRGRCIVARRLECLASIVRAVGRGDVYEWMFERAARGLRLEIVGTRAPKPSFLQPVLRFLAA